MRARLGVASILAIVLAACGESKGASGAPAKPAEPAVYVRNVCGALVTWDKALAPVFGVKPSDSSDSTIIRREFLHLFDSVQHATEALGTQVENAGTPRVSGGDGVARRLRDTVAVASRKLKANRTSFAAIKVTDVEPAVHVEGAMIAQGDQMDAVRGSLDAIDAAPALRQARERDPACITFSEQK